MTAPLPRVRSLDSRPAACVARSGAGAEVPALKGRDESPARSGEPWFVPEPRRWGRSIMGHVLVPRAITVTVTAALVGRQLGLLVRAGAR